MWWSGQNLEGPIHDRAGAPWHFAVWHDHVGTKYVQRIYFWNEARTATGLLELAADQAIHVRKLRDRMKRLAKDPEYRRRYERPLAFPLDPAQH